MDFDLTNVWTWRVCRILWRNSTLAMEWRPRGILTSSICFILKQLSGCRFQNYMVTEFHQRQWVARHAERQVTLVGRDRIQVQDAKHCDLLPNFPARHAVTEQLVQLILIQYHGWTGCAEPVKIATHNKRISLLSTSLCGKHVRLMALYQHAAALRAGTGFSLEGFVNRFALNFWFNHRSHSLFVFRLIMVSDPALGFPAGDQRRPAF